MDSPTDSPAPVSQRTFSGTRPMVLAFLVVASMVLFCITALVYTLAGFVPTILTLTGVGVLAGSASVYGSVKALSLRSKS